MIRRLAVCCALLLVSGLATLLQASKSAASDREAVGLRESGLSEGQALPALETTDDAGQVWRSADHVGKNILVIYAYPGDFTGGCIRQAQSFREGLAKLEAAGIEVVGLSGDTPATHQLFKSSHELQHTLLADPDGKLAEQLGMPVAKGGKVRTRDLKGKPLMDEKRKSIIVERPVTLPRWTLIVGRDGKLISRRTSVDPAKDAEEVLNIVAGLSK